MKFAGGLGAFMYVASQIASVFTWLGVILVLAQKELGAMAFGTFFVPPAVIVTVWWTTVPLVMALAVCIAGFFGGIGLKSLAEHHATKAEDAYWTERERRALRTRNIRAMEGELGMEIPEERRPE